MKYNSEKPSEAYLKAMSALEELLTAEGFDKVSRVYAETVSQYALQAFTAGGLKRRSGPHVCIHRLLGAARCPETIKDPCDSYFPVMQYSTEWTRDGKTEAIVSQPYNLNFLDMKQIVEFCKESGLQAEINVNHSWKFPGQTMLLKYRKA